MKSKLFWFACLASLLVVGTAQAEIIQIHVTGLNFNFGGGQIYDSTNVVGGNQNITQADPVETIDFFKDDVFVGRLDANIYAESIRSRRCRKAVESSRRVPPAELSVSISCKAALPRRNCWA